MINFISKFDNKSENLGFFMPGGQALLNLS